MNDKIFRKILDDYFGINDVLRNSYRGAYDDMRNALSDAYNQGKEDCENNNEEYLTQE